MNIKELIKILEKQNQEREIVLHKWDGLTSKFKYLELSVTPKANTKNLFVFRESLHHINPKRND